MLLTQSPSRLGCPFVNLTSQPSSPEVSAASTEEKLGTAFPESTSLYNYKLRVYQRWALACALGDERDGEAVTLWRQLQTDMWADWGSKSLELLSESWKSLLQDEIICTAFLPFAPLCFNSYISLYFPVLKLFLFRTHTMTLCSDQTQTPSLIHSLKWEGEEALHCPIILMYQMGYNHTELQEQS